MISLTPRHARRSVRASAVGAILALTLTGSLAVVASTVSSTTTAQAAPAGLLPPASGILPGPAAGGDVPGSWGPCVPDPDATDNCQGWLIPPGPVASFTGTDDGPNVIVGGNFSVPSDGGAETEGLVVVNGNATFDKSYSVGVVGAGTGVVPADRKDMFISGGSTTVNGAQTGVSAYGADASTGGYRTGTLRVGGAHNFSDPSYVANGDYGTFGEVDSANQDPPAQAFQNLLYSDVSVLQDDHYTDLFGADGKMALYSQQCYAELSTTEKTTILNEGGALTLEHGTVTQSGTVYTFTSNGTGDLVVFDMPATVGTPSQSATINVVGVKAGATVLVNTLATGTVTQRISDITIGAAGTPQATLIEGNRVLWNYPFATDITVGGDTQFPGSILVGDPTSTLNIGFSGTNGRVYTPGNLVHTGSAFSLVGQEMHSYPFTGALGCVQSIPGTFSVQKAITGDGASSVPADTSFNVGWVVTGPSDSPNLNRDGSVTVLADGTVVNGPTDLAEGDEVTFTETTFPDVPGIDWGTPTISPNPVTIGAADTVAAVTVTNTATLQRGGFTIKKAVTGDDGASTTSFDVDWSCDAPNAAGDDSGTVTVSDGASVTVTGFPVGTKCTISENTPTDDNGTWAKPVIDPTTITIAEDDGTAQVVTVTNDFTHAVGGFTIIKKVEDGSGASTTTFTGTWTCDAENADGESSGTWSLANGASDTHTGFPTGTTCSVAEDPPTDDNGTWNSSIDPTGDFVITEGDASATVVTVTNTFTHAVGGFTVTKAVTGDDGASTTSFDIDWTCSAANSDGDASGTITVGAGESASVAGFPTGTTCSFSEDTPTDDNGTWADPVIDPKSITIAEGDGSTQVVTVTNDFTHAVGGFTITKKVAGDSGAATTTFTGTWTCDAPDADGDSTGAWSLKDGGTDAHTGFPTGTTCSVAEDTPTDANGSWKPSIDPDGDFVITEGDASATVVTVTNTFTQAVGGFTIAKAVTGDDGASTTSFDIDWTCDAANADGHDSGTVTLKGGAKSDPITGFPVGTTCSVTEDTPTDDNGTWAKPTVSPESITIAEDDGTAQVVTVTNDFTASRGGFTIAKAVTGDSGASTTSFDIDWSCTAANTDGDTSGTLTLKGGASSDPITGFPVGTTCTVSEKTPTDDNGTWAKPVITPKTITIAEDDGTAQVVTVTNDFTHAVGGFSITKKVVGDDGASTTTFTGLWTCDSPDADGDSSGAWSLQNGGTAAFDGFRTGTTCSVTETPPTDANGTWSSAIDPTGDFTITEGAASARVVTVTNTFDGSTPSPTPTPTPTTSTPAPSPTSPAPTVAPTSSSGSDLATTGSDILPYLLATILLLALGTIAVAAARRRNE